MNVPFYIARKVARSGQRSFSRLIIRIAITAVALSVSVMILATGLIAGFKNQISHKIFGFWGHIHITDTNINRSLLEAYPVSVNQDFYPWLDTVGRIAYQEPFSLFGQEWEDRYVRRTTNGGIAHIQRFALKPGIIKTKETIEGVILKGIGNDFDWGFLQEYMEEGDSLDLSGPTPTNGILISRQTADRLQLAVGDKFIVYFVEKNNQVRRAFQVQGIYKTGLEEYDRKFALVDIRKIQQLLGWSEEEVAGFEVFIDDIDDLEILSEYIYLEKLPNRLYAESIRNKFPHIFEWLELQDINEVVILGLMLIVSIINMITALLILILERTNMIGMLKAIGQTNWGIRKIFLYYAGWIIMLGLLWGNLIGLGLGFLQQHFGIIRLSEADYYLSVAPVEFNAWTILGINLLTMAITLLFLVIPSYLVSRIQPVEAIRFK
jgi:lipoprotein-releasing system permease protein